jgi:hypothetical protein
LLDYNIRRFFVFFFRISAVVSISVFPLRFLTWQQAWGKEIAVGPLQHGQCVDFVVTMNVPKFCDNYLNVVLDYESADGGRGKFQATGYAKELSLFLLCD